MPISRLFEDGAHIDVTGMGKVFIHVLSFDDTDDLVEAISQNQSMLIKHFQWATMYNNLSPLKIKMAVISWIQENCVNQNIKQTYVLRFNNKLLGVMDVKNSWGHREVVPGIWLVQDMQRKTIAQCLFMKLEYQVLKSSCYDSICFFASESNTTLQHILKKMGYQIMPRNHHLVDPTFIAFAKIVKNSWVKGVDV